MACAALGFCSIVCQQQIWYDQFFWSKLGNLQIPFLWFVAIHFFLSKRCKMWKVHFCGCLLPLGFCSAWRLSSKPFKVSCSAKIAPNNACSGRFATFRLRAFFRSKAFSRFVSWFSWQPAAKASRSALAHKSSLWLGCL